LTQYISRTFPIEQLLKSHERIAILYTVYPVEYNSTQKPTIMSIFIRHKGQIQTERQICPSEIILHKVA